METERHLILKNLGRRILNGFGIPGQYIQEEYSVFLRNSKKYIVDLYTDYNGMKIIVECGQLNAEKLSELRNDGFFVLYLPYSLLKEFNINLVSEEMKKAFQENIRVLGHLYEKHLELKEEIERKSNHLEEKFKADLEMIKRKITEFKREIDSVEKKIILLEEIKTEIQNFVKRLGELIRAA